MKELHSHIVPQYTKLKNTSCKIVYTYNSRIQVFNFLFWDNYAAVKSHILFTQFLSCTPIAHYHNQEIDTDIIHRSYSDFTSFIWTCVC